MRLSKRTLALAISSLSILALMVASFFSAFGARAQVAIPSDETLLSPYTYQVYLSGGTSEEGNKYSFKARMAWQRELYGDLSQSFKEYMRQQMLLQAQQYPNQMPGAVAPAGVPVWTTLGPTDDNHVLNDGKLNVTDSARPTALLPHPTDPNIFYVVASDGGLWKTTNFTAPHPTWVPKTDGLFNTAAGGASFGRDPNTIYLGLGDPYGYRFLTAGGAMARSTDGGDTWSTVDLPYAGSVQDVKVDTSGASDIVLAATDAGIYRSTDGGASYSLVNDLAFTRVNSLVRTSAGWLAATEDVLFGTGSLYLSTDHGASWQPIKNAGNGFSNAGLTTLAVGAPGDSIVYAFTALAGDGDQGDLYKSTDGGQTWVDLNVTAKTPTNPNDDQPTMDLMSVQSFYNQMILVDPTDASRNTIYLGGELSSAKSTDGGQTWTLLTNWLAQFSLPYVHADFHVAAFSTAGRTAALFFVSDGGLFVSGDGGQTWSSAKNEGLNDAQAYALSSTPSDPNYAIIGLQDLGTRVRQGNTTIWNQTIGGDGFGTAMSQANGAVKMGSYYFDAIFSSTNKVQNTQKKWTEADNGIDRNDAGFYTPLVASTAAAGPTGLVFFTATANHLYKTTDGGQTWAVAFNTPEGQIRDVEHSIGVSPLDTNHIGVAGLGGRVFLTTDGGATVTVDHLIGTVPGWVGYNSNVAWANNQVIYASSEAAFSGVTHIARSTDGGSTWSVADNGLPSVPVFKVLPDPKDSSGNTAYAVTLLGIYQTTNGGASWSLFGAGLPHVMVSDVYLSPDGHLMRIATYGRGVWETHL